MTETKAGFERLRPLMFSIAYRMLGSVADAEDVVQDAMVRMYSDAPADVRNPEAYATTVTTRLAIDALKSARRRREQYVGVWLPEPLVKTAEADPAQLAVVEHDVSVALLVLLERLTPVERAVFLLREVFELEYVEIATVVGKSESNCRQLMRRARRRLDEGGSRYEPATNDHDRLAARFLTAVEEGDLEQLVSMLAEDAAVYGDGGGKAPALTQPAEGAVRVARLLVGLSRQAERFRFRMQPTMVNGQLGALVLDEVGRLLAVMSVEVAGSRVVAVRNQINPDKLRHLGEVGDLAGMWTSRRPR